MARATTFVRTTATNGTRLLAYAATIAAFRETACGASIRGLALALTQPDTARNADAEDVEPALREIEKVGIKQRADKILRNDADADPGRRPGKKKHPKMRNPHGQQQPNAEKPERNSSRQRLVVRIGCIGRRRRVGRRTLRKHRLGRASAVTEKRGVTHDFHRHFPESETG